MPCGCQFHVCAVQRCRLLLRRSPRPPAAAQALQKYSTAMTQGAAALRIERGANPWEEFRSPACRDRRNESRQQSVLKQWRGGQKGGGHCQLAVVGMDGAHTSL